MIPMMVADIEMEQRPIMLPTLIPIMMKKMDFAKMPAMMSEVMPIMKKEMHSCGVECTEMMPKMFPICLKTMTEGMKKAEKIEWRDKIIGILKKQIKD
jgi:hypothetical protein